MRLRNLSLAVMNAPLALECIRENHAENLNKLVFFQTEHNLVLPGGRDLEADAPLGVVPSIYNDGRMYHVRIVGRQQYELSDIIVEYNVPNVVNLSSSGIFPEEILRKIVYAPSLPWRYEAGGRGGGRAGGRELPIISNVFFEGEPRRIETLEKLRERCPQFQNVMGIHDLDGLQRLYANTKILVNFHRTWHHHSIEEFRILPALSQGCLVISEDVPLRTSIPYHEHVIWCGFEELAATAADVLSNYDDYYQRTHGGEGLPELLGGMKDEFRRSFAALLSA